MNNPFKQAMIAIGVSLAVGIVLGVTVNAYLGAIVCVAGGVGGALIAARA